MVEAKVLGPGVRIGLRSVEDSRLQGSEAHRG